MIRLQKLLADAGVASRRAGERLILDGRVSVDGETVRHLGTKVDPVHARIEVDGRPIRSRRKIYVALHKPRGFLCTRSDPEKRRMIGELLPREWSHLFSVGRLDRESEGLLFLTNDGDFALRLTHPRYGTAKTYRVTVAGRVDPPLVQKLTRGTMEAGEELKADRARLITSNNTQSVLEIQLAEGKNREIRRLLAALGFEVIRLLRIRIGPIRLGELPEGKWRTLTEPEIKSLLPAL